MNTVATIKAESAVSVRPHLRHLWRLSTPLGVYEHCERAQPRVEHGFCTDDSARLLVLAAREPGDAFTETLAERAVRFLEHAHRGHGRFSNRRDASGTWLDRGRDDDACGRALWGLGEAAASVTLPVDVRSRAVRLFDHAAEFRSRHLRSTAFAVLGAAGVLRADPDSFTARALLTDAARHWAEWSASSGPNGGGWRRRWPWPEQRLAYANAVIPEMVILAGSTTGDQRMTNEGLDLLRWLVDVETGRSGWLSVTPVGGWSVGEPRPGFDQQPIEVASLADAAATAARIDDDSMWCDVIDRCARWFLGRNDVGVPMVDWATGGGFDGLTPYGPNLNEGAESTMAAITALQHARRMVHLT